MQLDMSRSKITVEEQRVESFDLMNATPETATRYWTASLDGTSTQDETVRMERNGDTPDAAIKALFDAMTEAVITL